MRALVRLGRGSRFCLLAAVLTLTLAAGPVRATWELNQQLGKFAQDIKKFLDSRGEKEIAIGQFQGPPQLAANPGPGLALLLTRELEKHKVTVRPRAKLGLSGEFRDVSDETKPLSLELKVKVVDRTNRALQVFSCGLFGADTIAYLTAANTRLPDKGAPKNRIDKLKRDLEKPPVVVQGSRVSVGDDRPYAVEIVVNRTPRRATLDDGLPFVKVNRGEEYSIRLINNTGEETAVDLTIDGVNVFAFNEDREPNGLLRRDYRVIVPAHGMAVVQGWYRAKGMSDSFRVTEYSKSAAFLMNSTGSVGTITAGFRSCNKAMLLGSAGTFGDAPIGSSGTGFGKKVREEYRSLDRQIGDVRAVITVRYTKN